MMTVVKLIGFIIFVISCVAIYHNTNSYEPKKRILYIVVGIIIMYIITSVICAISTGKIEVQDERILNDVVGTAKWIFTPINALIVIGSIGNTIGKAKDKIISSDKAGKRLVIIGFCTIIIFIFEVNYISNFVSGVISQIS